MAPYNYRVKDEFKALFANLGTGKTFDVPGAFIEPGKPIRKDATTPENVRRAQLLQTLVDAGFVEAIDLDLKYVDKP
jgi:hypothetical protein